MPEIIRFFGIIITMYWNDHNPPHFHAQYGDYEAIIGLNGVVMEGKIPRRALSIVLGWLAYTVMNYLKIGRIAKKENRY